MSKYGYLEVFQRVPTTLRQRELTVAEFSNSIDLGKEVYNELLQMDLHSVCPLFFKFSITSLDEMSCMHMKFYSSLFCHLLFSSPIQMYRKSCCTAPGFLADSNGSVSEMFKLFM